MNNNDEYVFYNNTNKSLKELQEILYDKYGINSAVDDLGYFGWGLSLNKEEKLNAMIDAEEIYKNKDTDIRWLSKGLLYGQYPFKIGYTPILSIKNDLYSYNYLLANDYNTKEKIDSPFLQKYLDELKGFINTSKIILFPHDFALSLFVEESVRKHDNLVEDTKRFNNTLYNYLNNLYYPTFDYYIPEIMNTKEQEMILKKSK